MQTFPMRRGIQLGLLALVVTAVTGALSYGLVNWLGIRTAVVRHRVLGDQQATSRAYVAGSSLLFDALDHDRVSKQFRQRMETWFVAGSSPSEWEPFQSRAPAAKLSIL